MRSETASINRHESSCGRLAPERSTRVVLRKTRARERLASENYYTTERGLLKIEHL